MRTGSQAHEGLQFRCVACGRDVGWDGCASVCHLSKMVTWRHAHWQHVHMSTTTGCPVAPSSPSQQCSRTSSCSSHLSGRPAQQRRKPCAAATYRLMPAATQSAAQPCAVSRCRCCLTQVPAAAGHSSGSCRRHNSSSRAELRLLAHQPGTAVRGPAHVGVTRHAAGSGAHGGRVWAAAAR